MFFRSVIAVKVLGWKSPAVAFLVGVLAFLLWTPGAAADGGPVGSDVQIAQTLGDRELTVVIRRVGEVPGPLSVDVITHAGSPAGTLDVTAIMAGKAFSDTKITLGAEPGAYGGVLRVDRAGPWELAVGDGTRVARIPFVVPALVPAPWEQVAYGGFVTAGALLLVALFAAVRARRTWMAVVPATGLVAALAVAITAALLSSTIAPPPEPGEIHDPTVDSVNDPYALPASIMDTSRPPVNLAVSVPKAVSGEPVDLELALHDSATGRPADDLLVHHNALVHLVLVGPSGRLWHLHPVRTAPGAYTARFTPPEPGRYALSAELARRGGGTQLVRSTVDVQTGVTQAPPPEQQAEIGIGTVRTGSATTLTAKFGTTGDLQPWLGMAGHLMVIGPLPDGPELGAAAATAPVWAHVHSMTGMPMGRATQPDETVAAYGPEVRFTYTFPAPGRYRLWFQAMRDYSLMTVPAVLDVPAAEGEQR